VLAQERFIVGIPDEMRSRLVARARASLQVLRAADPSRDGHVTRRAATATQLGIRTRRKRRE
jgi:hypothetical protein